MTGIHGLALPPLPMLRWKSLRHGADSLSVAGIANRNYAAITPLQLRLLLYHRFSKSQVSSLNFVAIKNGPVSSVYQRVYACLILRQIARTRLWETRFPLRGYSHFENNGFDWIPLEVREFFREMISTPYGVSLVIARTYVNKPPDSACKLA